MGTPSEKNWPGVTQLPDFRSIFPKWDPQILPAAITHHQDKELCDLFKVMILTNCKKLDLVHMCHKSAKALFYCYHKCIFG